MLGLVAGTGLHQIFDDEIVSAKVIDTPYGLTSAKLYQVKLDEQSFWFLPRHGESHSVPPHLINYRANIWALKEAGVSHLLAFAAVGGITPLMKPGALVLPDQIIDYTYGRQHTFFEENFSPDQHIDFTHPYSEAMRKQLLQAAEACQIALLDSGVYACTQGPRLETAAEIQKLKRDACDVVGMTAMPEAALARELGIDYAAVALVVNWAAGLSDELITMESIKQIAKTAEADLLKIIRQLKPF